MIDSAMCTFVSATAIRQLGLASLLLVLPFPALAATNSLLAATNTTAAGPGVELIRDPRFRRGFHLCRPTPGRHERYADLPGFDAQAPVWDLVQWSSRFPLEPRPLQEPTEARVWTNLAKRVVLGRPGSAAGDLVLEVIGSAEYGNRARQSGEPWVHLLAEQPIPDAPALAEWAEARFRIGARLLHAQQHRTPDYSPGLHAAQFQVFFTLQYFRSGSPGAARFLWFGVPLYDDRHRVPPAHKTRDTAGSEMFIFTPAGDRYTRASAHDGDWIRVDEDLLPLLREALETAWTQGFLADSRDFADYRLTSINLGWEVPGILDVAMQVRDLSLEVRRAITPPR